MKNPIDPIQLEVFKHRFAAIAEEMGAVLQKASFSPNIKERRDFSCAIFTSSGQMISQAAHIPVHLGSMPLSVKAAINSYPEGIRPGDIVILNDPFEGGTHLPDITLVSPVYNANLNSPEPGQLLGYVASRAHHADVGGMTPGSMPIAQEIYQEGLIIPPTKLMESGIINQDILKIILANVRTPDERSGDIWAQIAANKRGEKRLNDLFLQFSSERVNLYMNELLQYTERMTRKIIESIPDGRYTFTDYLDDDGITHKPRFHWFSSTAKRERQCSICHNFISCILRFPLFIRSGHSK